MIVVDRETPNNLAAERSVLGGVLVKPSAFDEMATTLTSDDFLLPSHREIFAAMLELDKRRQPIDVVSLGDELKNRGALARLENGQAYLIELANAVPTAENIAHYARLVQEKATLRRLIAACAEIQSRAYGADMSSVDDGILLLNKIRSSAMAVRVPPTVSESAVELWSALSPPAIPTPFVPLDRILGGGWRGVTVIVAPTGVGKTGFALQAGRYAARTIPVYYVSTELSRKQTSARVSAPLFERGWREMHDAGAVMGPPVEDATRGLWLYVDRYRDLRTTLATADAITAKAGMPCMLVLDYLQGAARDASVDRRLAVGAVMQSITDWSESRGSTSLVISSTARVSYVSDDRHGRDLVSTAKEAGEIEYAADAVLYLKSDQCPMGGEAEAQLSVAKARWGALGDVGLTFYGATGTYRLASAQDLSDLDRKVVSAIRAGHKSRNAVVSYCHSRRDRVLDAVDGLIQRGVIDVSTGHLALNDANLPEPPREPVPGPIPASEPLFDSPTVTGGSQTGSRPGTGARKPEVVPTPLGGEPESGTGTGIGEEDAI